MNVAPHTLPGRLDRRVRRGVIRCSAEASRERIAAGLEDALRLAELPGEREGRLYVFRKVSLGVIRDRSAASEWREHMQRTLGRLAAASCRGTDPRAAQSDAVYFDNREQALVETLRWCLQTGGEPVWFLDAVLEGRSDHLRRPAVPRILERLRQPDLQVGVAASMVLEATGDSGTEALLRALPLELARQWVHELADRVDAAAMSASIALPPRFAASIRTAVRHFGWRDARTVWFTTQVVLDAAPHAVAVDEAVRRATATLLRMESEEWAPQPDEGSASRLRSAGAQQRQSLADSAGSVPADGNGSPRGEVSPRAERTLSREAMAAARVGNHPAALLGVPTQGAGLYFLLPVLKLLGIAEALEKHPELGGAGFVSGLLLRLAAHADLSAADPILECLRNAEPAVRTDDPEVRRWAVAVRRWCSKTAHITAPVIIRRPGLVWLTRTDLDVTLPLADAEVRIRRWGLDIDPGWVPWLGGFGTVVRFHYRDAP